MVDIKSTLMFLGVFKRRTVLYLILLPLLMTHADRRVDQSERGVLGLSARVNCSDCSEHFTFD